MSMEYRSRSLMGVASFARPEAAGARRGPRALDTVWRPLRLCPPHWRSFQGAWDVSTLGGYPIDGPPRNQPDAGQRAAHAVCAAWSLLTPLHSSRAATPPSTPSTTELREF